MISSFFCSNVIYSHKLRWKSGGAARCLFGWCGGPSPQQKYTHFYYRKVGANVQTLELPHCFSFLDHNAAHKRNWLNTPTGLKSTNYFAKNGENGDGKKELQKTAAATKSTDTKHTANHTHTLFQPHHTQTQHTHTTHC